MLNLKVITIPYVVRIKRDLNCKIHHRNESNALQGTMKENTYWWACKIINEKIKYIAIFNVDGQVTFWSTDEVKSVCVIRKKERDWVDAFDAFNSANKHLKFIYNES